MGDCFHVSLKLATDTTYTKKGPYPPNKPNEYEWYAYESRKIMFNGRLIYLQHRKNLYSDTVENVINFYMENNAATEKVDVAYCIAVSDEDGIIIEQASEHTWEPNSIGYSGFYFSNITENLTDVTCVLQIQTWTATPICRAKE